jgi:uncharacterized protein (TIGR00369 family)
MAKSEHYSKLERMYLKANVNQVHYPTTSINITEREAEISIEVDNTYHHALGGMHGSVYFKLLDDAAFFAASSVINDVFVLTSNFNIHFFRPHATGKIIAQGKVEHVTKNVIVASSTLYNEQGKELGRGSGSFMKSKVALTPEIGYQ